MYKFNLKKGLDIPVAGMPKQVIDETKIPNSVAVLGPDYNGLKPKMFVKVGDKVQRGSPLFCHKDNPNALFVSPSKGYVKEINRGEKRVLLSVVIDVEDLNDKGVSITKLHSKEKSKKDFTKKCLLDSGLWTSFLTRPYSKIPDSETVPSSIFVTAMNTDPLCPDAELIIKNEIKAFEEGINRISLLTTGKIFICTKENSDIKINNYDIYEFAGPHPAGLPGTHMHFLNPPNSDNIVWSVSYQDVIAIGNLFLTGFIDVYRTISVAGPLCTNPRLIKTITGASIDDILEGEFPKYEDCRIISGSILSGFHAIGDMAYLGKYSKQITIIKEDKEKHFFGWIKPQPNKYSVMPVLLSAFRIFKKFELTSNLNGGRRAMVPTGVFENLMPQDLLPTQLLRSLLVMDTDVAQSLGVLELDEEDLALCTFACPAKYEYGTALRDSLTKIEKEG